MNWEYNTVEALVRRIKEKRADMVGSHDIPFSSIIDNLSLKLWVITGGDKPFDKVEWDSLRQSKNMNELESWAQKYYQSSVKDLYNYTEPNEAEKAMFLKLDQGIDPAAAIEWLAIVANKRGLEKTAKIDIEEFITKVKEMRDLGFQPTEIVDEMKKDIAPFMISAYFENLVEWGKFDLFGKELIITAVSNRGKGSAGDHGPIIGLNHAPGHGDFLPIYYNRERNDVWGTFGVKYKIEGEVCGGLEEEGRASKKGLEKTAEQAHIETEGIVKTAIMVNDKIRALIGQVTERIDLGFQPSEIVEDVGKWERDQGWGGPFTLYLKNLIDAGRFDMFNKVGTVVDVLYHGNQKLIGRKVIVAGVKDGEWVVWNEKRERWGRLRDYVRLDIGTVTGEPIQPQASLTKKSDTEDEKAAAFIVELHELVTKVNGLKDLDLQPGEIKAELDKEDFKVKFSVYGSYIRETFDELIKKGKIDLFGRKVTVTNTPEKEKQYIGDQGIIVGMHKDDGRFFVYNEEAKQWGFLREGWEVKIDEEFREAQVEWILKQGMTKKANVEVNSTPITKFASRMITAPGYDVKLLIEDVEVLRFIGYQWGEISDTLRDKNNANLRAYTFLIGYFFNLINAGRGEEFGKEFKIEVHGGVSIGKELEEISKDTVILIGLATTPNDVRCIYSPSIHLVGTIRMDEVDLVSVDVTHEGEIKKEEIEKTADLDLLENWSIKRIIEECIVKVEEMISLGFQWSEIVTEIEKEDWSEIDTGEEGNLATMLLTLVELGKQERFGKKAIVNHNATGYVGSEVIVIGAYGLRGERDWGYSVYIPSAGIIKGYYWDKLDFIDEIIRTAEIVPNAGPLVQEYLNFISDAKDLGMQPGEIESELRSSEIGKKVPAPSIGYSFVDMYAGIRIYGKVELVGTPLYLTLFKGDPKYDHGEECIILGMVESGWYRVYVPRLSEINGFRGDAISFNKLNNLRTSDKKEGVIKIAKAKDMSLLVQEYFAFIREAKDLGMQPMEIGEELNKSEIGKHFVDSGEDETFASMYIKLIENGDSEFLGKDVVVAINREEWEGKIVGGWGMSTDVFYVYHPLHPSEQIGGWYKERIRDLD